MVPQNRANAKQCPNHETNVHRIRKRFIHTYDGDSTAPVDPLHMMPTLLPLSHTRTANSLCVSPDMDDEHKAIVAIFVKKNIILIGAVPSVSN